MKKAKNSSFPVFNLNDLLFRFDLQGLHLYQKKEMTLQQMEYIVALARYGKFSEAAEHCHVTQPTLSMQVKKLEEELGLQLFNRNKQPIRTTAAGAVVVQQAEALLRQLNQLKDWVQAHKNELQGDLRVGIIPTVAPYLVPYFLGDFVRNFPNVHLHIVEAKTEEILVGIRRKELDFGVLVTPLAQMKDWMSRPLFYEKFLVYLSPELAQTYGNRIEISDLLAHRLWVLSEGNCFRSQTVNLCALSQLAFQSFQFTYESGSLETLIRLVDREGGLTLLPELAVLELPEERMEQVKFLGKPNPVREVSLVYDQHFVKFSLLEAFAKQVESKMPAQIKENTGERVIEV